MSGASLNRVQIIGNLGADPEIRTLPGGTLVAKNRAVLGRGSSWATFVPKPARGKSPHQIGIVRTRGGGALSLC
jgi:hypothetical protein